MRKGPFFAARRSESCVLALAVLGCSLLFGSTLGCGEEAPAAPSELPPLVGALELPISLRNDAPTPSGALRIEASTNEIRVEGRPVYTNLVRGMVADEERGSDGLVQLLAAVRAAPARSSAALTLSGLVPFDTAVRLVQTLRTAGYSDIAFAVRPPGFTTTATGWLALSSPIIAPPTGDVTFSSPSRRWEEFAAHWRDMYTACRGGQYIDCDGAPAQPASGGELQVVLWARGEGMQMRFQQVHAPAPTPTAPARVALIEGVPAPPSAAEPPPPPDTNGVFSFRAEEATRTEPGPGGSVVPASAISLTARPVCGAMRCQVVVEADPETPIMRVLSFLGAAFPNGAAAPEVAWRLPR